MRAAKTSEQPRRYLVAQADLVVHDDGDTNWDVPECPWCGAQHRHGGDGVGKDPRAVLGHRISHCCTIGEHTAPEVGTPLANAAEILNLDLGGYFIVDADPRHTAELMESLEIHEDDFIQGVALKGVGA